MNGRDHHRIGPTAHYTAHVWKRLGLPYADLFATPKGAVLYWSFFVAGEWITRVSPRVPSMQDYLEYRHRLVDAVVCSAKPDVLVEVGAGFSPRALQWALDHGVRAVEIDLPHIAAAKRAALEDAPNEVRSILDHGLVVVPADVLDQGFASALADLVRGAQRPVVVAEGLVSYFDPADRRRLFEGVARGLAASEGGTFVADLHTKGAQATFRGPTKVLRLAITAITGRRRALEPFEDAAAIDRALRDAGFDEAREVLPAEHLHTQPRLARLRSPAHVWVATVSGAARA